MSKIASLTLDEINDVFNLFDIDIANIISHKSMYGGQGNYNYLIETSTSKKMVLCIFHDKPYQEIQILVNLLDHLANYDFKTTKMITTSIKQVNSRYVILKNYVTGNTLQLNDLSQSNLFEMGTELARLHNIPPPSYLISYGYRMELFDQITSPTLTKNSRDEFKEFKNWLNNKKLFLEKTLSPTLPKGLVHADLFWDNVLFLNGKLEAIIDFEESCLFFKAFDLGMCFVGSCVQVKTRTIDLEKARSLVSGYQRLIKLSKLEKDQLKHLTEYAAVSTAFLRFNTIDAGIPKEKLRDYKEMMGIADWVHELTVDDFLLEIF